MYTHEQKNIFCVLVACVACIFTFRADNHFRCIISEISLLLGSLLPSLGSLEYPGLRLARGHNVQICSFPPVCMCRVLWACRGFCLVVSTAFLAFRRNAFCFVLHCRTVRHAPAYGGHRSSLTGVFLDFTSGRSRSLILSSHDMSRLHPRRCAA